MRLPTKPMLRIILSLCVLLVAQGCVEEENGGEASTNSTAPDFSLTRFDNGNSFRLADHRGNPLVINFFASWCTTCGIEVYDLQEVYQEFASRDVMFVGVAIDDTEKKARQYVKKYGITYPTGLDTTGAIKEAYGIFGLPYTFFVDRRGNITYVHAGAVTAELLRHELEKIF